MPALSTRPSVTLKPGDVFGVKRMHAMKSSQLAGIMTEPGAVGEVNEINTWPDREGPISDIQIDKYQAIDVLLAVPFLAWLYQVTLSCGILRITICT